MVRELSEERRLVGRLLCGKWRIERLIGSGGMSSVYAAVHRNGNRVAVKILSQDLTSNRQVRSRFVREGYIANRIGHPGAVNVLDDEADGDVVFLVMELLDGETLAARASRHGGRLAPSEVAFVADGLLEVLDAAHGSGIVHRDVKPENVFLTRTGQVKLLDFGIASLREVSLGMSQTRSGVPLGTPGFMAPEQARGRWSEVDGRTDLWAVGATMFRVLTGGPVHPAETASETIIAAATEPAATLAGSRPDLPPALVGIVDRALAFAPADRFQNAREMQIAIGKLRTALATHLWQPPPPTLGAGAPDAGTISDGAAAVQTVATVDEAGRQLRARGSLPSIHDGHTGDAGTAQQMRGRRRLGGIALAASATIGLGLIMAGRYPGDGSKIVTSEPSPPALAVPGTVSRTQVRLAAPPLSTKPGGFVPALPDSNGRAPEGSLAAPKALRGHRPFDREPAPRRRFVARGPAIAAAMPDAAAAGAPPISAQRGLGRSGASPLPGPPLGDATAAERSLRPDPASLLGPIVSERPRSQIPPPALPRAYEARDRDDLARICGQVEREAITRAGVTPAFANGVTAALCRIAGGVRAEIHPVAMYYFIISEAALGHDKETAASNLLSSHKRKALRKLSDLPAVERKL